MTSSGLLVIPSVNRVVNELPGPCLISHCWEPICGDSGFGLFTEPAEFAQLRLRDEGGITVLDRGESPVESSLDCRRIAGIGSAG